MNDSSIPPVRDCSRFEPGHSIHWIQARLINHQPLPRTAIEVVAVSDLHVLIAAEDGLRRFQNHDLGRLQALVDVHGPFGALVGYHALRLESGHLICVREGTDALLATCRTAS